MVDRPNPSSERRPRPPKKSPSGSSAMSARPRDPSSSAEPSQSSSWKSRKSERRRPVRETLSSNDRTLFKSYPLSITPSQQLTINNLFQVADQGPLRISLAQAKIKSKKEMNDLLQGVSRLIPISIHQIQLPHLQYMQTNKELQQSRNDFQKLISEGSLPPKMEAKLRYLQAGFTGRKLQPSLISELPEFQKLSLQMMNRETQASLFNSIVRCLAGRDVIVYFTAEPTAIKREDSSARSVPCFISCTSEALKVSKNKEGSNIIHTFQIEKLLVAKIYHSEKKHFLFGIAFQNVKYRFKFEQEGPCARIHGALLNAIREKRAMRIQSEQRSKRQQKISEQLETESVWDETGQELIIQQQRQYLKTLIGRIEQTERQSPEKFQLVKNIESGKIVANRQRNIVKVLMFLQKCSLQSLIESYIQFGSWNVQVEAFQISKRIRHNTFLAYLRLKKKNIFSSPREGYFTICYFKYCACLRQGKQEDQQKVPVRHYLLMTKAADEQGKKTGVEMSFNQIVQFSEVQGRPGVVLVNLMSHIDFNVYQYFQNSTDLNLEFVQEVGSISTLCREREIIQTNKCQLFEFGMCVCDRKKKRQHFLSFSVNKSNNERSMRKGSLASEPDHRTLEFEEGSIDTTRDKKATNSYSAQEIIQIVSESNALLINEKILDIIQNKLFENYYLHLRFPQQTNEKPYIDSGYHLNERLNFLDVGSRWKFNSSEEYVYIQEQVLNLQKGVLKLIVKQITSNLMAGKSIMTMSLPVELFDDYSTLQSFSHIFGFVPVFMQKAIKEKKTQQQIKYVALAFIFIFACKPKVSKPFNPILGETCQGMIGGIPFYMEQISHHPPISNFFMKNEYFQAHGSIDIVVDMGLNSANTKMPSPIKVKIYQTNTEYTIKMPDLELGGIMFGSRTLKMTGKGFVIEKDQGIYLEFGIGKEKKKLYEYKEKIRAADLTGGVFKITNKAVERLLAFDRKKAVQGIKSQEAIERYSLISGKWYGDMYFDGVCYKSVKNGPFPVQFERSTILLPSDCTFRLDIVYRRWRNFKKSNEEKEVLQNLQRRDRKLRQKYHPHHKH